MSDQGGVVQTQVATDVLQEIVAVAGDPALTLDGLGQQMNLLYQLAEQREDAESVALVTVVWDGVVKLSEQTGHALNIATAAREIAQELQRQRDEAIQTHEELQGLQDTLIQKHRDFLTAVKVGDRENAKVDALIEEAHEEAIENLWESGAYISYCPACDILETAEIPVSHDIADAFHDILCGSRYGEVSDEILQEIADFMVMIVHKVDAEDANNE